MAKSREQKQHTIDTLTELFKSSKSVVFSNFTGVTVADITQLRVKCRQQGVGYMVAKKTLIGIASKNAGVELDARALSGEVAAVFGITDEVAPAKIVAEFKKTHESVNFVGGLLDNHQISPEMVASLAKLPSKQELIAKVLGSVRAPLSGLVNVLQGNVRGLVQVLHRIKEAKSA